MARLRLAFQAYTHGRAPTKHSYLAEDEIAVQLTTRTGTRAEVKLFADGSGVVTVRQEGKVVHSAAWAAEPEPANAP